MRTHLHTTLNKSRDERTADSQSVGTQPMRKDRVTTIWFVSAFHCPPQSAIPAGSCELESRPACRQRPAHPHPSPNMSRIPAAGTHTRLPSVYCLSGSHFRGNGKPTQTISELPGFESGFSLMDHSGALPSLPPCLTHQNGTYF